MVHKCSAGLSCIVCDVHEGLWRLRCSNGVKNVRKWLFTKSGTKLDPKMVPKMDFKMDVKMMPKFLT